MKRKSLFLSTLFAAATLSTSTLAPLAVTSAVVATSAAMTPNALAAISTYDSTNHKIIWANTAENAVFKYVGAAGESIAFNTPENWNKGSTSNGAVTFPETAVTGNPTRVSGGYLLYFDGNDKTMTFSGNGGDSSDGGGIWVSGTNNNVTVSLGGWAGSIQVDAGNILNTSWNAQLKDGHIVANGIVNITGGNLNFDGSGTRSWYTGNNGQINIQAATGISNGSILLLGSGKTTFSALTSIASGQSIEVKDTAKVDFGGRTVGGSGTLKLNEGTTLGNITLGTLTLDLSALTLDNSTAKVTLDGSVSFTKDAVIKLNNVTIGTNYKIFNLGTATLDGLTYKNFSSDSVTISGRSKITSADGVLSITLGTVYSDLVWANEDGAVWNTTAGNKVWSRTEDTSNKYDFANGDSVTFNTVAATVTVAGTVDPNAVTVSENTTFTGTGTVAVDYTKLTISTGKMLTIDGNATLDLGQVLNGNANKTIGNNNISGSGTVKIESKLSSHAAIVNLGSDFNGTLDFTGQLNWNNFTVADSATLRLSGTSSTGMWGGSAKTINNNIVFASNEYKIYTNSSNITMNGNVSAANAGTTLYFNEGTSNHTATFAGNVDFSGSNITVSANTNVVFSGASATIGTLKVTGGSTVVVFGSSAEGATNANYTITGEIQQADNNGTNRTFTIHKNATVTATALRNSWGLKTLTVDGVLNLTGAAGLFYSSGDMTNTITGTGTINTTKFTVGNVGTYVLDGGININIGSGGIVDNKPLQIKNATIGASANWTSSSTGIKLGENAKFNTNEHTITLSSALGNIGETAGKLTKLGAGTLVLDGNNTFTGGVAINVGTLRANHASALGTGAVTIAGSATLDVSALTGSLNITGNLTTSDGAILNFGAANAEAAKIASTGTVTLDAGTIFDFTSLESGTLKLISGTGLSAEGFDLSDLRLNGKLVNQRSTATFKVVENVLTLDYMAGAVATLTWAGDATGTWTLNGGTWTAEGLTNPTFQHGDSVIFSTANLNLTLNETVSVGAMTVNENMTLTGTGTVLVNHANLTIGENKKLTINENITLNLGTGINGETSKNISGAGTVMFASVGNTTDTGGNDGSSSILKLADDFSGKVSLTSGILYTGSSVLGTATVNLNGGGILLAKSNETKTFSNNITVSESGGVIRLYGSGTGTISGSVSGTTGTLTHTDGGTLTFTGKVELGTFRAAAGTTTFSGETIITTANISAGTTTFSGNTTIGTLNYQDGSALNFSQNSISTVKAFSATGAHSMGIAGVLNIIGDKTGVSQDTASFMMANGGGKNTITIQDGGVLNLASAGLSVRDGDAELNITTGGEVNFGKGLRLVANSGTWGSNVLNLNGGTLNVGSSDTGDWKGITTDGKSNVKVNLNSGTLGSLADSWTSSLDFALGGQITVDTTKKEISSSGKATEVAGQMGSTVTLSGVLSNATDATASLTKIGLGTLILSGANTFSGGVDINAGTLVAKNATALGTGTATVADGAMLELGDGAGTLANAMIFANNATLSLAADATLSSALTLNGALNVASDSAKTVTLSGAIGGNGGFNIGNLATVKLTGTTTISGNVTGTGKLQLASGTTTTFNGGENNTLILGANVVVESGATVNLGGTIEIQKTITNTGTITLGNGIVFNLNGNVTAGTNYTFNLISGTGTINGIEWGNLTKANFTYDGDALDRFEINLGTAGTVVLTSTDYIWGGTQTNWENNNAWTHGGTATNWTDSKNALFQTPNASVTIGSAVTAANVYIEADTTITGIANLTLGEGKSIVISNEKTLTLGEPTLAGLTKNVSGTGTLKLALINNNWSSVIDLGSAFAGTVYITGGRFTINNSNIGTAAYVLGGNTGFQVSGGAATIANAIKFTGGTHEFHTNTGANLTLTGDFTVDSGTTVAKKGSAVFNIQGNAQIDGTFKSDLGTVTVTVGADKKFVVGKNGSFSNNGAVTNNGEMDIAGTFLTSGKVTTAGTLTVSGAFTTTSEFEQTTGTVNFENGANVTLRSYKGPSSRLYDSVVKIASGATVSTTGDFVLRYEGGEGKTSTLDLVGTLTVNGGLTIARDGNGTVNINDGGKLIVSGKLGFGQNWAGTDKSSNVNLNTGGTLVVGADGVGTSFDNLNSSSFNLAGGTLGTSADAMTVAAVIPVALVENTNTTINTAKYNTTDGTFDGTGATITVESAISGVGALTKDGAGTLVLSGENTFTGGLTISNGAVNAMNVNALGAGTTNIGTNGTLNILANMSLDNVSGAGTLNIGDANTAVTATRNYTNGGQGLGLGKVTVVKNSTLALVLAGNRWGVSFNGGLHGTLDVSGNADLIFAENETLSDATLNVAAVTQIYGYKSLSLAGVTIKGDGTLNTNNNANDAAAVTLTGNNEILLANIAGAAESSLTVSSETTEISSNMSAFAGTLTVNEGATINPTKTIAFGGTAVFNGIIDNVGTNALFNILETAKGVSFGTNVKFNLSTLDDGETTLTVFSGDASKLTGWNQLSEKNVTLNGEGLGSRMEANFDTAGKIVISAELLNLVWNGGTDQTIWKSNDSTKEIWNKKDANPTEATYFVSGDSVIFNSNANLTIEAGSTITVKTLTVENDTTSITVTLTNNGTLVTTDGITINNEDGKLVIAGTKKEYTNKTTIQSGRLELQGEKTINAEISGTGTLALMGTLNANAFDFGDNANLGGFQGMLSVGTGATLTMASDAAPNATLALVGTLAVGADNLSLSSKISGTGTVSGTGANSLTFAGALSEFTGTVNNFVNLTFAANNTLNAAFNATEAINVTGEITLGSTATLTAKTLAITGTTDKTASLRLNSGTQLDTISGDITLTHGKLSGVTLAANKTIVANAGAALENVTLAENSMLTVAQNGGSLTFTGTNTLAGTLQVFNSTVNRNAMITVAAGTTDITKVTFNLKLSELDLPDSKGEMLTYNIFSTANDATLNGWENLKKENIGEIFSVEGVNVNDAHINLGFVESGKINVTLESLNLVYAGGDDGVWKVRDETGKGWTGDGVATVFFQLDSVTFETENAEVQVAGTTLVNKMTVNENLELTNLGAGASLQASGGLTLAAGKELTLTLGGNGAALTGTTISAGENANFVVNTAGNTIDWATAFAKTKLNGASATLEKTGSGTLTLDLANDIGDFGTLAIAGGSLALANSGEETAVFSKSITGSGTLEVASGTVKITGFNYKFDGDTIVSGGSLILANESAIGEGELTIGESGRVELTFDATAFENKVSGTGTLAINPGVDVKVTLGNNAEFKGRLEIATGTAIAANENALGVNTTIAAGATLEVTAKKLSSNFTGAGTLNVISDNGAVVEMSGEFGGFTGTFNVGDGNKTGTLKFTESLNAAVNVNKGSTLIFNVAAGEIELTKKITADANSAFKKQGAGTLVLNPTDEANDIKSGKIEVEAGTLKVHGANAIGNSNTKITLANDTTFEFVVPSLPSAPRIMMAFTASSIPTATETFANSVLGTGKTLFSGGGVVNVTGQNEATGGVDVVGGTKIVTNGMNNVGTGAVNIGENSAWYANHNVVIGGNGVDGVAMGASGSLHVGSATFTGTALNNLEINATGTEILISVNSLSDLNRVHASGGRIDFTGAIIIETADGIDLNGKVITLFDYAVTLEGKQTIVVNGEAGIYNMIRDGTNIVLSTSAIAKSFNLGYSSMVAMSRDVFGQDEKSLHNRMEARRFETRELGNTEFFAQMQGSTIDNGKDVKKSGRFDYNTYGALVGGDIRIATGTLVGFALGYDHGKADIHDNQGKIEMDNYRVTAFASQIVGNYAYVEGGISAGTASYELTRSQSNVRESLNGYNIGAFARLGAVVPVTSAFSFLPYAGLSTYYTTMEDFKDGIYDVDSADAISLQARVGASLRYDFAFSAANKSSITFDIAYACELADDELETEAKMGTTNFKRKEIIDNDNFVSVGAEFSTTIGNGASVFMGYSADIGEDTVHHANAGLRYKF